MEKIDVTLSMSYCCCRPPRTPAASRHVVTTSPESPAHQHLPRALHLRLRAHQRPPTARRQAVRGRKVVVARASSALPLAAATVVGFGGEAGKKLQKKAKRGGAMVILFLYRYLAVTCKLKGMTL